MKSGSQTPGSEIPEWERDNDEFLEISGSVVGPKMTFWAAIKVWVRFVGFHEGENAQFNLANHRLEP